MKVTACPLCEYEGHSPGDIYLHLSVIHRMTEKEMIDLLFAVVTAILEELCKLKSQV